jgi:formamidopyrimidine-DNA glycosylase
MPELPEVETYARDLAEVLPGRRLHGARLAWPRQAPLNTPDELGARLRGQAVLTVSRRGKYLVLVLSHDWLIIHLKMSGRLYLAGPGIEADPHAHVVFRLDGGGELRFRDPRKFGRVYLVDDPRTVLGELGVEPLAPTFTAARLSAIVAGRRRRLKPLLLDQTLVAGLGNIYVDESLWLARLHPLRLAGSLDPFEVRRLHRSIRRVLRAAVRARGSSLSAGGYRDLTGNPGEMQGTLAVYGRAGDACPRCGSAVRRLIVGGRSTHVCPTCQPGG